MISVKIDDSLIEPLKQIADNESRSQGAQIEYWIKKEAERLKIPIPPRPQ